MAGYEEMLLKAVAAFKAQEEGAGQDLYDLISYYRLEVNRAVFEATLKRHGVLGWYERHREAGTFEEGFSEVAEGRLPRGRPQGSKDSVKRQRRKDQNMANQREFAELVRQNMLVIRKQVEEKVQEAMLKAAQDIKEDALAGMRNAWGQMLAEEGSGVLNNRIFTVISPVDVMSTIDPVVAQSKAGFGAHKSRTTVSLFNPEQLDKADRFGSPTKVKVLIKSNRGEIVVNGVPCAVKEIELEPRNPNKKDHEGHAHSWTYWRVIEYGRPSSNASLNRVRARTVQSVSTSKGGKSSVSFGPEVVFMSARSFWWAARADAALDNIKVEEVGYWGGSAPIFNAFVNNKGSLEQYVEDALCEVPGISKNKRKGGRKK